MSAGALTSNEVFAGRTRRHAPKILALPAFFVIAMHAILIADPQSVPAVPGIEAGHHDLIVWFVFVALLLFFANLRLVMAGLCLCAAAANTALTHQWVANQLNQQTETGFQVTASWLLQSETGLFYLLGIGAPLLMAVIWAMHQTRLSIKRQLYKRAKDGFLALLLAGVGVGLAWMAVQRPTVYDYAQQFDTELVSIENRIGKAAETITARQASSNPRFYHGTTPLDPLPVYDHRDFKRSNVAVVQLDSFTGESWQSVYARYSKRRLFFPGPLAQMLANRHMVYANHLRPIEPYAAALKAAWWVLYSAPKTCDADHHWVRAWLVRASNGDVLDSFEVACGQKGFGEVTQLFKDLARRTGGTFKF